MRRYFRGYTLFKCSTCGMIANYEVHVKRRVNVGGTNIDTEEWFVKAIESDLNADLKRIGQCNCEGEELS